MRQCLISDRIMDYIPFRFYNMHFGTTIDEIAASTGAFCL